MNQKRTVDYDGRTYTWDGSRWYDSQTFTIPPVRIITKLNALIQKDVEIEDSMISNIQTLLKRARAARDAMQYERSERIVRRVLNMLPEHLGALAILCSTLRARGDAQRAIDETEAFRNAKYSPLLNSRAAALCDLNRWEEAKREVGRSLAINKNNEEAFLIVNRIKAANPSLYE